MSGQKPNWFIGFPIAKGDWCPVSEANAPDSVSLYHPDDLHLTIAFLGAVSTRKAMKAWEKVSKLDIKPIVVSFNAVKPFGLFSTPSAYGLTINKGRETISQFIVNNQKSVLSAAGKKPRDGRVVPHVTIARPGRRLMSSDAYTIAEWRHSFEIPDVEVVLDEVALYTWADSGAPQRFKKVEIKDLK